MEYNILPEIGIQSAIVIPSKTLNGLNNVKITSADHPLRSQGH